MAGKFAGTLADVAAKRAGFAGAVRALHFTMGWGLATAELGHEPESIEEYAEVMEVPVRTAYRHQQAFRKAFPEEATPGRINRETGAQARYDQAWKGLSNRAKAQRELAGMPFWVGAQRA